MKSNKGKSAAVRKPLAEISNGGGGEKQSKSSCKKKKENYEFDDRGGGGSGGGAAVDRLLLLRSDLAGVVEKIDELVAYIINHKVMTKSDRQEVQSFSDVLSDMISPLKPWIERIQHMVSSTTATKEVCSMKSKEASAVSCAEEEVGTAVTRKNDSELEMMLSPSPLVSWHDGSSQVDGGRQLFLLTPIPKAKLFSSKQLSLSSCVVGASATKGPHNPSALPPSPEVSIIDHSSLTSKREMKPTNNLPRTSNVQADTNAENCVASSMHLQGPNRESSFYLLTPCTKVTPSKNSMHSNPVVRSFEDVKKEANNATQATKSKASYDTFDEISETLSSRYQELFGQPSDVIYTLRRDVDETLDWFLSPPKTCILLEPSDDKVFPTPHIVATLGKGILLATPMSKNIECTANRSKLAGENTLKKELWTRFEAVSTNALQFDASVSQRTSRKGFLDMLEEASS